MYIWPFMDYLYLEPVGKLYQTVVNKFKQNLLLQRVLLLFITLNDEVIKESYQLLNYYTKYILFL